MINSIKRITILAAVLWAAVTVCAQTFNIGPGFRGDTTPVYIVDGTYVGQRTFNAIDTTQIESLKFFIGNDTLAFIHGLKGQQYGVYKVKTKNNAFANYKIAEDEFTDYSAPVYTVQVLSPTTLKITTGTKSDPFPYQSAFAQIEQPKDEEFLEHSWAAIDLSCFSNEYMRIYHSPLGNRLRIKNSKGENLLTDGLVREIDGHNAVELITYGKGSFYGTGERGHGLNLRGDTLTMYNRQNYGYTGKDSRINQMNITMPMFLSTDGYAIVFDDFSASKLILGDTIQYISENAKPLTYYFIVSKDGSLASLTEEVTKLTGRQELPPFWSLGYITSKYGYHNRAETEGAVDTLKSMGYPLDGIVLDLYWYGKEQDMGRLEWDKDQWPDPKGMLAGLKDKGVNLVAISQPYVLRNGRAIDNYNTLAPKGMFVADSTGTAPQEVKIWVGEGGMFDVSNPATKQWLSDRYDALTQKGVSGWWGDLGEPEVHPETGMHANGLTARQYHNQYGNDWSEIIYDLYKEKYPDTRLMSMMRGGTTGLQRYDVFPWSTDVSRSWGGLEPQITIMTQSGLSGLGYMGHDVGGFAVDPANAYQPELYLRWLQLGTFSPILRTHAQLYAEPYHYPEIKTETLKWIKERYRWLPYNYSLAYENATKGYPMVRPLEYHSTKPTGKYDNIRDQYMWGSEVMIAPVLTEGATTREVTMPETTSFWYDLNNTGKTYKGGETVTVDAPLNVVPMFAHAGAFIPTAEYLFKTNTRDYRTDDYTISYYVAPEGELTSFTLFEDDRTTPSAKGNNQGVAIEMTGVTNEKNTVITMEAKGSYKGVRPIKTVHLKVYGLPKSPKRVKVNDVYSQQYNYDKKTGILNVDITFKIDTPLTILLEK